MVSKKGRRIVATVSGEVSLKRLSVSDILACKDLEEREVPVPEWGGAVLIRSFSKRRQQELRKLSVGADGEMDSEKLELLLFTEGVVDPEFTSEHWEALREKSAGVMDRVIKEIMQVSGMTVEAEKAAEKRFPA